MSVEADRYEEQGFGETSVGFGVRPAILVVDFQRAFTDPGQPMGGSEMVERAVLNTVRLLEVARSLRVPVIQTFVGHDGDTDALRWKIPAVRDGFRLGSEATELDPRTHEPDYDIVVRKIAPSILFQTPAVASLIKWGVDTTIITGCNTSGCVRASVVDAFSYGFRVIVPEDCVGDVEQGPHDDTLRDVGRRYSDVVSLQDVVNALKAR